MRHIILVLTAILIFSALINLTHSKITDADGFYHIRHAWIYRTNGLFQNTFPWTQYSAVNRHSADLWYGFHILIIPLTYFADLITGIKIGGFLTTAASLALIYWALKTLRLWRPEIWLIFFALASPDLLYRLTMLRPHPLSLGLLLIIFAYLVKSEKTKKDLAILALTGATFSWIHLSLAWLPILIALIIFIFYRTYKLYWTYKSYLALTAGLLTGWLLRPNPIGTLKLAYIQVVDLFFAKDLPIRFGRELTPFVFENFVDQLIPIALISAVAIGFFVWTFFKKDRWTLPPETKAATLSSLLPAILFFYLAFSSMRRANEIFIGLAVIFIGLITGHYLKTAQTSRYQRTGWQTGIGILLLLALIYMPIKTIYRFETYITNAFEANRFQETTVWLKENTKPGEIIFNIHWDRFAQLFFWNQHNYYINGMDPIFQYSYSPELYWKTHFYAVDKASTFTCGAIRCTEENAEDTHEVLKNDFRASYLLVEKRRNPKLSQYLMDAVDKFSLVFENETEALYKLL